MSGAAPCYRSRDTGVLLQIPWRGEQHDFDVEDRNRLADSEHPAREPQSPAGEMEDSNE